MTAPRCSQCKWQLDPGERHGLLECRVHMAVRVAGDRLMPDGRLPARQRGLDVSALRTALRDVVALQALEVAS